MIKITLPWPPAELFPNRKNGKHFYASQERKVWYRSMGYEEAWNCREEFFKVDNKGVEIFLDITFYPIHNRNDKDGMISAIKAGLDGIAKGWGINDRRFSPTNIKYVDAKECNYNPRVEINFDTRNPKRNLA